MPTMSAVLRFPLACGAVLAILTTATAARQGPQTPDAAQSNQIQGALVKSLEAAIVKFGNTTLLEYAALPASRQKRLAPLAQEVARVRRAALKQLIRRDPETALQLSLTPGQRQGLPVQVLALLEARIHAVGDLTEAISEGVPLGTKTPSPRSSWTASIDQTTFEAYVYGVRSGHHTKYDTPLHGIAIDAQMAVDESPLYQYDLFEKWQLGFLPGDIVATSGGLPILLPNPQALIGLRLDLLNRILRFGPYPLDKLIPPGDPHPWTTGVKRVLVIQADFSDRPGVTDTDAEIIAAFDDASSFYEDNSQGRASLTPTILPTIVTLPLASGSYAAMGGDRGAGRIRDDAKAGAQAYDATAGGTGTYDPDSYDRFVVLTPQVFPDPRASGDLSGKGVVVTGEPLGFRTLAHELGHTFGFTHSNFWLVPFGSDPLAPGTSVEYGDVWDMMGGPYFDDTAANPRKTHFNAFFKWLAGWLPYPDHLDAITTSTFRLYRHDAADAAGLRAIRIDADADKWYWLDIRRQFPWNPSMAMGIEVRRVTKSASYPYGQVELLDMDPMNGGARDHSLTPFGALFGVFDDTANGIRIVVIRVGTDATGDYADVRIER